MLIEIECSQNKVDINHVEIGNHFISFFLSSFFKLNFKDDEEEREFFKTFLNHSKKEFSKNQSYAELDSSLFSEKKEIAPKFILENTKTVPARMYRFQDKDFLELSFYFDKGTLTLFLSQDLVDKIKREIGA